MTEQEVPVTNELAQTLRQALVANAKAGQQALDRLDKTQHAQFVAVCHVLLKDADRQIQKIALRKLGQRGDRDDVIAENEAIAALAQEDLHDTAIFALGTIGSDKVFPILFEYARSGNAEALSAVAKQARTDEQRRQVVRLARRGLFSPILAMRYNACEILQSLSNVLAEEHLYLASSEIFTDEFTIFALRAASAYALPRLQRMLRSYPPDSVQYRQFQLVVKELSDKLGVD